jgi:predicted double-glycine peptidase
MAVTNFADELLDVPHIQQDDSYSCGAAAAMSVGKFYNVGPDTIDEWKQALGTDQERSTSPPAIASCLSSLGLPVRGFSDMTIADLDTCWRAGFPVICPIQQYGSPTDFANGHYVVVVGVAPWQVVVNDPAATLGRARIEQQRFEQAWHDRDADGNRYIRFGIVVGPPSPAAFASHEELAALVEENGGDPEGMDDEELMQWLEYHDIDVPDDEEQAD